MDEVTKDNQPKYKLWPDLDPHPNDTATFRRLWARIRDNERLYNSRRLLAHDYKVAKSSGREK